VEQPGFSPWISLGYDQRFNSTTHTVLDATQNQAVDTKFGGWAANVAFSLFVGPLRDTTSCDRGAARDWPTQLQRVVVEWAKRDGFFASESPLAGPGARVSAEARISNPVAAIADVGLVFPVWHRDYVYTTTTEGEKSAFLVPSAGLVLDSALS